MSFAGTGMVQLEVRFARALLQQPKTTAFSCLLAREKREISQEII